MERYQDHKLPHQRTLLAQDHVLATVIVQVYCYSPYNNKALPLAQDPPTKGGPYTWRIKNKLGCNPHACSASPFHLTSWVWSSCTSRYFTKGFKNVNSVFIGHGYFSLHPSPEVLLRGGSSHLYFELVLSVIGTWHRSWLFWGCVCPFNNKDEKCLKLLVSGVVFVHWSFSTLADFKYRFNVQPKVSTCEESWCM